MDQNSAINPWDAVHTLLAVEEDAALEAALAAASPLVASRVVTAAPGLARKTQLLWAMEDRQRREVLELVPPALIGALVQNFEDDNRYLLGDLSVEQFRSLLRLCSPERKYYWVTTALSFTDARANALPLLLSTPELVDILLTRAEWEAHVRLLGDYPMEAQRIPPEMMADPAQGLVDFFGADNMLRQFPVTDPGLEHVLQTILDYDPDRYVDLIRGSLRRADYAENHPTEWDELTEDPVLLEHLGDGEVTDDVEPEELEELPVAVEGPPLALVPVNAAPLARLAATLSPAQRTRVSEELQYLYIRQGIAEGGSFHESDLTRVARSVEAYLQLGLRAESRGNAALEGRVLASRPLNKVLQSGARTVERLRQVALRLEPLEAVLSPRQRALVKSIVTPRLILGPDGGPRFRILPGKELPESAEFETATALLREVAAWADLARAVGFSRTEAALKRGGSVESVLEELALAAVLYLRLELGLLEPDDLARFRTRYLSPAARTPLPEVAVGLRRTIALYAEPRSLDVEAIVLMLELAVDRLAERAFAENSHR